MGDWSAWASGYGAFGDVSGSGGLTGYEYRLGGFSAGIDKRVMPNLLVGVVGGYTRADINLAGVEDKVGSDGGQIGVYGSWASGPLQVSGLLSYGFNQNRSTRRVTLNSIDTLTFGEYGSQNFGAAVMAGYTLVTPFADIQPIASVEYVNVHTNGFTESGAEPLNLVVNGNDSDSLRPGVGVRLAKTFIGAPMFGSAGPVVWMPEAHARWTHELLDNTHVITAAFSGAQSAGTFQGSGVATGRSQILAGGGLSVLPNGNDALKVFAGYNADLRDKLTAHVFNAGVRMTW
jgi:outer membrane autotransporter protein